jgi:hypothetical protein
VIQHRGNKSAGAIRISIGLVTNFADVYRFMYFAAGFRDKTNMNIGQVTFDIQSCRVIRDGSYAFSHITWTIYCQCYRVLGYLTGFGCQVSAQPTPET